MEIKVCLCLPAATGIAMYLPANQHFKSSLSCGWTVLTCMVGIDRVILVPYCCRMLACLFLLPTLGSAEIVHQINAWHWLART